MGFNFPRLGALVTFKILTNYSRTMGLQVVRLHPSLSPSGIGTPPYNYNKPIHPNE